jgi:glycosyltransferase involved in cell wall biosynthesis
MAPFGSNHTAINMGANVTVAGAATIASPTVSIVIPTYNEARHIERVISGFLQTGYPQLIEVLVVDGGSTDGTVDVARRLAQRDARVRLLQNPAKVQSAGLNIGIAEMKGAIFIRADAHSDYAPDYVEQCVATLLHTKALNVGGCQQFVAATPFQAGVALAARSVLGNGGSSHRSPNYNGPSDTVFLGCCWRHDLERVEHDHLRGTIAANVEDDERRVASYFDLDQITNQDSELNVRFRKLAPKAIYVSSTIKAWYYPRSNLRGLMKQYFRYGRGRYRTASLHPTLSPARVRLPLLAALGAIFLMLVDLVALRGRLRTRSAFAVGLAIPFVEGARVTFKQRQSFAQDVWRGDLKCLPSPVTRWWWCSVALLTMTPSFLCGYLYQLVRRRLVGVTGW